jgi:hypothetical protein
MADEMDKRYCEKQKKKKKNQTMNKTKIDFIFPFSVSTFICNLFVIMMILFSTLTGTSIPG